MKSEIKPTATNGRDSAESSSHKSSQGNIAGFGEYFCQFRSFTFGKGYAKQSQDRSAEYVKKENLSTTVPKGPKTMIKLIKGGLFLLALSAASSLQQLSYAQIAEAPASSIFTVVHTPNIRPFPFHADLAAVSASSGSDIWAVGQSGVHFDGLTWTAFALPHIAGDLTSGITGVADLAPNNVWSVGNINIGEQNPNQIIEHFDGTRWSVSHGPSFQPTDQPHLEGLTAISATNMWAAGAILTTIGGFPSLFPLFEHFDGTSWTATIDQSTLNGFIFGISADATNDVWAVGTLSLGGTLIEHFDGTAWSVVPSPNTGNGQIVLFGVTAIAPNDAWAVGFFVEALNGDRPQKTLTEHWDGTSWTVVPSPNVGGPDTQTISNQLRGVIAESANDVWAFGDTDDFGPSKIRNLVLHWNGTAWSIVPSPDPNPRHTLIDDVIAGGTVIPQGNLWLVGVADGFGTMVLNATGQ